MPKKMKPESPADQSRRFQSEAERLIAAGELDPTEAEAALDSVVRKGAKRGHN
jgi:hypothetical protein